MLVFLLAVTVNVAAQENDNPQNSNLVYKGFYLGAQASTNGWGFDARYIFNKTFTVKMGLERLYYSTSLDFTEGDIDYEASLNYKTGGIFLLVDFNYTKNLYISAGAAMNSLNPEIKGVAVSEMQYGDITIPASMVGDFTFTLTPSMDVSPYVGLGFRSFMGAKERVTFSFETGLYYLGAPNIEIEATGLLAPTADPAHGQKELMERQLSQYKFYPVIKINLAVRLF
ncbi:MAG: hypothetical protein L3J54_05645 [Draconibacterium sp.]|nr:hypothetical protein [Draconibacterium sp.]